MLVICVRVESVSFAELLSIAREWKLDMVHLETVKKLRFYMRKNLPSSSQILLLLDGRREKSFRYNSEWLKMEN